MRGRVSVRLLRRPSLSGFALIRIVIKLNWFALDGAHEHVVHEEIGRVQVAARMLRERAKRVGEGEELLCVHGCPYRVIPRHVRDSGATGMWRDRLSALTFGGAQTVHIAALCEPERFQFTRWLSLQPFFRQFAEDGRVLEPMT